MNQDQAQFFQSALLPDQAKFFQSALLPIIREAAEDREEPHEERNSLRPMLCLLLAYADYLESRVQSLQRQIGERHA
jgi:hypothetical protein